VELGPLLLDRSPPSTVARARAERLSWLVRLRWFALGAVLVGAIAAPWIGLAGLHVEALILSVAVGAAYNAWFLRSLRRHPERTSEPLLHMALDFGALTLVLWASGGVSNPFVSLYFVHLLVVSTLSGRDGALLASGLALLCVSFLFAADATPLLRISSFDPTPRLAPLLDGAAFFVTFVAAAYVAQRSAAELTARRDEAVAAKRASRRDTEILLSALDRLEVGVEVLGPDGAPRFQNRHLREHVDGPSCGGGACERDGARCPMVEAREGHQGTCRFQRRMPDGRERVIEMHSFPLGDESPASVLRLHLDRTDSVLAERKLLFAEKLASLGRTVQAVAHELNTPLATIQTLAADMRVALAGAPPEAAALRADLDESAAIILDEMRRCRAITQGLLAGREALVGASTVLPGQLGGALDRAATLVFGAQHRERLVVDPAVRTRTVAMPYDGLVQVFVNLLQNALDVVEPRPGAKIRVGCAVGPDGRIVVEIDDEGPGLPPGLAARLFEAFITTKPPGKGTGLGLYTARALVRDAGGELSLHDRPEGGARARLVLPEAERATRLPLAAVG
jgi:signal transduction histidine kinase